MKRYVKELYHDLVRDFNGEQVTKALKIVHMCDKGMVTNFDAVRELIRIKEET